jgi:hypothetical protein
MTHECSLFTSRPDTLLASNESCAFYAICCGYAKKHHQHRQAGDLYQSVPFPPVFLALCNGILYAKMKRYGDKARPCLTALNRNCIRQISDGEFTDFTIDFV